MRVREPTADGHRVLRVEDVRGGRVVDYDGFPQVTADLGEVLKAWVSHGLEDGLVRRKAYLNIIALVVVTALSEKAMMDDVMDV